MIEDQSYELQLGENHHLSSTANNAIPSSGYDLDKYDPYVEKIRTLFVPSLEPRIYSFLETFVYRRDYDGSQSDSPYLKRCLDVAATFRDPVEAFCTKWRDSGFLEKMLANAVKFLIGDGLIDCFLNSIILNNRLNKVCRDLDALDVEKDLLRYLAVWNYTNERDYWLEDDKKISKSKSERSYDSIDHHSDLDVEVGSGLDGRRDYRGFKRAFKRRASDDSSEDPDQSGSAPQNVRENERTRGRFPSRLSIDSSNPEGSRSSGARKKIRSCQAYPCGPSNCPSYRMKNAAPGRSDGRTLKLQLRRTSRGTLESGRELGKSMGLSKLPFPCKYDDLIAEIVKAYLTSSGSFLVHGRKKFQAAVTSVCCRVNEILGKIDRKEVGRCRLHCEILPGCVSFRLTERDPDGCKVCLFSDRVAIDRIDQPRIPRGCSDSKSGRIGEQKNADEAELTMYKNTGFSPADDESQIVRNFEEEATIKTEPEGIFIRLSDDDLEATDRKNLEQLSRKEALSHSSENKVDEPICASDTSFDDAVDRGTENNDENSLELRSRSKELTRKESLNRSNGNAIADDKCDCNNSVDDTIDETAMNKENNETISENNLQELPRGESLNENRSSENLIEDETCGRVASFDDTLDNLDRAIEANRHIQESNHRAPGTPDFITNSHENEQITDSVLKGAAENDEIVTLQQTLSGSSSIKKCQSDVTKENWIDNVACACPSDCACPNRCTEENQPDECDSQCSCNSCRRPDRPTSLKKTEIIRTSSLPKPAHPETLDSGVQDSLEPTLTQRNETLVSASDELQCSCLEAQADSSHSQNHEFHDETSVKSDTSLESNVTKIISFIEAESKQARPDRGPAIQQKSSAANKSPKKLSTEEHPIISARLSRPKAQRINISIEVCPESESSTEQTPKNEYRNEPLHNEFEGYEEAPLLRKPRCHSVEPQPFEKQVLPQADKNTKDECLGRPRGTEARVHSPPRPLESRDYLPPFEPPWSMRNPIVYGMSMKSGIRTIGKFERRSMSQDRRQRGGRSSYETKKFRNVTKNRYESTEGRDEAYKRAEMPKHSNRVTTKPDTFSAFGTQDNVCHAFSASSVDRMKHLIKTKLRRILLERDKATNTPKTTSTNKKYRVSVPEGKTDRSPFRQQRCRTIWESRSASDSARTSRSFVSNDRMSPAGVREKEEVKKICHSTAKQRNLSAGSRNIGRRYRCSDRVDDAKSCEYLNNRVTSSRNSEIGRRGAAGNDRVTEVDLDTNFRRLAGGSDFGLKNDERYKTVREFAKRENRCASDNNNGRFDEKSINHSCKEYSEEAGDSSARNSRNVSRKKITDELTECSGKLDCSGNSTSRHIYLYEFDRFESSNDEMETPYRRRSPPKICSPEVRKTPRKSIEVYPKKLMNSRPRNARFTHKASVARDVPEMSNFSSKINPITVNSICHRGFGNIDQDLRRKLSQYVNLCKNVKYSLLKRLRPDDIYEVSRTSIPCCDRCNFGDS